YAHRAYPAEDVPFSATLNALRAWDNLKTRGRTLSPNPPDVIGSWSLVGPDIANFPAVLTFSGAPYTASGRITALAVDPTCGGGTNSKNGKLRSAPDGSVPCRVWAAAAGGGVWITTNALDA